MNKRLQLAVRNAVCTDCRLSSEAEDDDVCVTGQGPNDATIAIVTKSPVSDKSRMKQELIGYLTKVGIDHTQVMWLSALKCRTWDLQPNKSDQKACASYLRQELAFLNPTHVLCLGSEAWFAASGWADITKNRGKLFDVPGGTGVIYPTISPSAVARNPGLTGGFIADLHNFSRLIQGVAQDVPFHTNAGRRVTVGSKEALRDTLAAVRASLVVSYDIESTISSVNDSDARVVSIALTVSSTMDMETAVTYEIPLFHPESFLRDKWREALRHIVRAMAGVKHRIAHNAKFDTKWLKYMTGLPITPTFDTIIALALLDENSPKGLKPAASTLLGADPWGMDTSDLLNEPLDDVLEYNGLDTWHTLRLYFLLRKRLAEQPRLARLFKHLMMPAICELVDVELRGVYVHQDVLAENWREVKYILDRIHQQLQQWIPETNPFVKVRKRDGVVLHDGVNFNPSNFLRWWLFEHLELPVLARGKTKDDGTPGDPSTAESIMMVLAEQHPAAALLLERVKWNKYDTSFFKPWSEQIDANGRIHSTFKPWGTVTGRLSSGKEDSEKITAKGHQRGVNLQQVPRGSLTRSVFGAPPGSFFIEADYSQVELRVAALLSRERTMMHLYATGQDIHMAMAMRMTGKPEKYVTKEERKAAKAVNFGFLYGMGWRKFIMTAWSTYGLRVTEEEAIAFRKTFFAQFPMLLPWHAKQRRLAHQFGRVETPMGRVRHLPDIYSPDPGVVAEAERQAINSPVQAFASDMALLALVHTARKFRKYDIQAWPIGTVHDAVNFEVEAKDVHRAVPIIKRTMENLPLERLFGVVVDIPIVADIKVGTRWGSATEIPADIAMSKDNMQEWIRERTIA
jgi:uracil-DNA glycosylase family 4